MRRLAATVLALVGVLVCAVSVVAVWGRNQVLDTERYLETVAPLASDPVIQDELADRVADVISDRIEVEAPSLTGVRPLVSLQAHAFMESDEFAGAWRVLNREGHRQLVRVLTDRDGEIQLDLSSVVDAVRVLVAEAGLAIVREIPPISLVVDVAEVDGVDRARSAVRLLDRAANTLPLLALLVLGLAVAAARRRLRAGTWLAAGVAVAALAMLGLVHAGAWLAAAKVPDSAVGNDAVHAYYGHLTSLLRNGYLTLAAVALVAGAVCASVDRWRSGSPAHWRQATGSR